MFPALVVAFFVGLIGSLVQLFVWGSGPWWHWAIVYAAVMVALLVMAWLGGPRRMR